MGVLAGHPARHPFYLKFVAAELIGATVFIIHHGRLRAIPTDLVGFGSS